MIYVCIGAAPHTCAACRIMTATTACRTTHYARCCYCPQKEIVRCTFLRLCPIFHITWCQQKGRIKLLTDSYSNVFARTNNVLHYKSSRHDAQKESACDNLSQSGEKDLYCLMFDALWFVMWREKNIHKTSSVCNRQTANTQTSKQTNKHWTSFCLLLLLKIFASNDGRRLLRLNLC
jgi:hypothetical protein